MNRPNILYLHPADIGRWVQPYGYPVRTPHLQQIAERGVTFRNAFATSPSCSPSRAALLTGQYPVQNGNDEDAHPREWAPGCRPSWK
jgi:N-sulfoglucosamine sulfohydrolase